MEFKSTGLNYTKEEIEINGNQVPLGKLHDEVCDYMESEWKVSESEILNISTALWKALEVLNNELVKRDERIKELEIELRNFERAELIQSNREDVLPAIQEATHYNWLDDQLHEKDQLIFNLEEKYQESVEDIENVLFHLTKMMSGYDYVQWCNASLALDRVKAKYGLDKQESKV